MSYLDKRAYHDWTAPVNGHRFRIVITPWGYTTLDLTTSQPAFGASASGDYIQIPHGVIPMGEIKPSATYDKVPLGLPDSPGMAITLDFAPCEGDSDLEDLWDALVDPEFVPTGTLTVDATTYDGPDPWIALTDTVGRKVRTANYFELLTDGGNASLGIDDFKVVGAWCQHIVDEPEETYNPITGSDTLKIELTSAFRYAAEEIGPSDIATVVIDTGIDDSLTRAAIVDSYYTSGSVKYYRTLEDVLFIDDPREYLFFRWAHVPAAIDTLLSEMFTRLMRTTAGFTTTSAIGDLVMYEYLDLREQAYTSTGEASSTRVTDPYFPGLAQFASDPGTYVDGWLYETSDAGKDRLFGYATAYELLKALIEGGGVVGSLGIPPQRNAHQLLTTGILYNGENTIGVGGFKGDAWVMKRARRIASADAELNGAISGDRTKISVVGRSVANDSPRNIPVVFNCLPQCGEKEDVLTTYQSSTYVATSPLASYNTLCYPDTINSVDVMVRCHHHVGTAAISEFNGSEVAPVFEYYTTNAVALPAPAAAGNAKEDFWYPLRLALLEIQGIGGISYGVASFVVEKFGHRHQTLYPASVAIEKALPLSISTLSPSSFGDASDLTGKSRHATYPGFPILMSTELDIAAGTATVELLALGGIS